MLYCLVFIIHFLMKQNTKNTIITIFPLDQTDQITLPYNLPPFLNYSPFDYTPPKYKNDSPPFLALTKDPFDSLFFKMNGIFTLGFPWVPFFSNCEKMGKTMTWFDIMENNHNSDACVYRTVEVWKLLYFL